MKVLKVKSFTSSPKSPSPSPEASTDFASKKPSESDKKLNNPIAIFLRETARPLSSSHFARMVVDAREKASGGDATVDKHPLELLERQLVSDGFISARSLKLPNLLRVVVVVVVLIAVIFFFFGAATSSGDECAARVVVVIVVSIISYIVVLFVTSTPFSFYLGFQSGKNKTPCFPDLKSSSPHALTS